VKNNESFLIGEHGNTIGDFRLIWSCKFIYKFLVVL